MVKLHYGELGTSTQEYGKERETGS